MEVEKELDTIYLSRCVYILLVMCVTLCLLIVQRHKMENVIKQFLLMHPVAVRMKFNEFSSTSSEPHRIQNPYSRYSYANSIAVRYTLDMHHISYSLYWWLLNEVNSENEHDVCAP